MAWTGISSPRITMLKTVSRPQKRSFDRAKAAGKATTIWIRKMETVTITPLSR
ncbi:MAG: Uncharacterised protein [SAR116 cluster bacterium MED-G04]|nr:MAG: Uncharacterised protein [SAR116 cluster bacterium MED-G04]